MNRSLLRALLILLCVPFLSAQPGEFNWKPVDGKDVKHAREKYRYRATFEKLDVPFQTYELNAAKGSEFQLASGTEILVPANAFITKNGAAHTGAVSLKYRELYHPSQVLSSGIPMYYGKPESFQNLQSAGMFEIEAWAGTQELFLKENKNIQVKLAAFDTTAYKQYYLEANGKQDVWRELKEASIQVNQKKLEELKKIKPAKSTKNSFTLQFDTTENNALSSFQQAQWEYAGSLEDTNSPFKQTWVQQEKWNRMSLGVEVALSEKNKVIAFPERYRTLQLLTNDDKTITFSYSPAQEKTSAGKIACIQGASRWESDELLRVVAIDASSSGRWIAASDKTALFLWDVTTGNKARILRKRNSDTYAYTSALKFDETKKQLNAISSTGQLETFDLTTGSVTSVKNLLNKKIFHILEPGDKSWFSILTDYQYPNPITAEFYTWNGIKIGSDTIDGMSSLLLSDVVGKYAVLDKKSRECLIKNNGNVLHRIPLENDSAYSKNYFFNPTVVNTCIAINHYQLGGLLLNWKGEKLLDVAHQIQSVSSDHNYVLFETSKMKIHLPSTRINKKFETPDFIQDDGMSLRNIKTNQDIHIQASSWSKGNFNQRTNDLWITQYQSIYKINPDSIDTSIKILSVSNELKQYSTAVRVSDDVFNKVKQLQQIQEEQDARLFEKSLLLQASFQRQFEVNQMGIYNVDKIADAGNLVTRDIKFIHDGKAVKKSALLYQITGAQNNVVVKNNSLSSITFSAAQPNNFILIVGEKMALISDTQFKQVLSNSPKALTFPVTFSEVPEDEKDFQAFFQGLTQ